MGSNGLTEVSSFVIVGRISPSWRIRKNLQGLIERDKEGHYFISNEALGVYAVGFTHDEAMADFMSELIYNYQRLEARAGEGLDLTRFFQKYQEYLERSKP